MFRHTGGSGGGKRQGEAVPSRLVSSRRMSLIMCARGRGVYLQDGPSRQHAVWHRMGGGMVRVVDDRCSLKSQKRRREIGFQPPRTSLSHWWHRGMRPPSPFPPRPLSRSLRSIAIGPEQHPMVVPPPTPPGLKTLSSTKLTNSFALLIQSIYPDSNCLSNAGS